MTLKLRGFPYHLKINDLNLFFNVRTSHPVSNKFAGIVRLVMVRLVAGLLSSYLVKKPHFL